MMRQSKTRTVAEHKPLGVIDAVSAGLDLVRRRPWTLLIPILIDTLIWVAPRLSLTQLFRPYAAVILNAAALSSDPQAAEETRQTLQQMLESLNLLSLVATALNGVTRLPSLFAMDAADITSPITAWAFAVPVQSSELLILLFIPFFLLGLLAVAVYLEWIAQGVRPLASEARGAWALRAARLWLRLILFSLLLLGVALAAGAMLLLLQLLATGAELGALVTLFVTVGLLWIFIYCFFVPSAMAVSDIGALRALQRSVLLFRIFFWSTLALVALSVFLERGLALVWDGLTLSAFGVVVGILGSAFIGTALIAASMVYYQDRMNFLERKRQAADNAKK